MPPAFVRLPQLLLPAPTVDLSRFAVIACDQFTAEPALWAETERLVDNAPSALHLILPEVYLDASADRTPAIHRTMQSFLQNGTLRPLPAGLMLIERHTGRTAPRRGVLLAFDLEAYEETPGADAPIRPTEATVTERLPARLAIRSGAAIELPHILLFLDDPTHTVLEPLFDQASLPAPAYDFPLMQGGGRITGRLLPAGRETAAFFDRLSTYAADRSRYSGSAGAAPLVFATGDGNHSMSAAKAHWTRVKQDLSPAERLTHPARWVLAELVNLHDESICFEAVHRLLVHTDPDDVVRFLTGLPAAADDIPLTLDCCAAGHTFQITIPAPPGTLPVAVLQQALDGYLAAHPQAEIDFIHGTDTLTRLSAAPGHIGFILPDFPKSELFPQVLRAGVLPRKTFSMGTALEKRYYLEARPITPAARSLFPACGGRA